MSDPDLIERVAQASFQGGWHAAHPDVRADWRGAVAAIIGAYEADRDRPWPRFAEGGLIPTIGEPRDTIPVPLHDTCHQGIFARLQAASCTRVNHPTQRDLDGMTGQP